MCRYFSCIVTRDLKVHWSKSGPNHEAIIAEAKLDDSKLENRDFVRIEITPRNVGAITRDAKDWILTVDEPSTIPKWFEKKQKQAERKCWLAWRESVKTQVALGEEERTVMNNHILLCGSSHAELWGSSHAELWGSSHAELRVSSHAELWGSSHAVLWGSSHAVLWGSSHAELWDSSHAVLWDSSHAELRNSSHAELRDSSHAVLWDSSHAELRGSSHAVLRGSSHAELWDSSHAALKSKFATVLDHGTGEILVTAEAKVKVASKQGVA